MFHYQFHISPALVGAIVSHLPHVPPAAKQIIEAVAGVAKAPFDVQVSGGMDHTGLNMSHITFAFNQPIVENPSADERPPSPFVAPTIGVEPLGRDAAPVVGQGT